MLEIMKFVAELAERVGYAEAKLEEAESLIDEMEDALCENDEDVDEAVSSELNIKQPDVVYLNGKMYICGE